VLAVERNAQGNKINKLLAAYQEGNTWHFDVGTIGDNIDITVLYKGDINMNGDVTASDSVAIDRFLVADTHPAHKDLSELEQAVADINGDGKITALDSILISRSILSQSHPAYKSLD
jgi:uncharacterized lipoprotein YehR (DUF1307 family)